MKKIKLFCLPYAGGSATIYSSWKKMLGSAIEVIPVELAGRGARSDIPFYQNITNDGLTDVFSSIQKHLDGEPFAIFGHSMGTVFAYELSHRIKLETNQSPIHIFFSGRGAPHKKRVDPNIHSLPDEEFQTEILKLGGTSKEVFEHKDLADIFVPILKADYRLVETYIYEPKEAKLDCNITVLYGKEDRYDRKDAEEWGDYTNGRMRIEEFDGNHFFINSHKQQVVHLIQDTLSTIKIL